MVIRFVVAWVCYLVLAEASWWAPALPPNVERAQNMLEGVDPVVEKALRDFQVPGAAIGVVIDGHIIVAKGYGVRGIDEGGEVDADTLFAIGSCTKAFTAFVCGCLVDEGLLQWDLPVSDALSDFRLEDTYATHAITMRDLLAHRTGIPRHDFLWYNSAYSQREVVQRLRYLSAVARPRERFQYSNVMYLAAGMAAERVSGKTWPELVQSRILSPLDMKRTFCSMATLGVLPNAARPHIHRQEGAKRIPLRDLSLIGPAGSMVSGVGDLCKWIQLQQAMGAWNQKPLISMSSLKELYTPQIVAPGQSDNEEVALRTYGLGWYVQTYRGRQNLMHEGGIDGFTAIVSLLPQEGIGIVVLSNKNLSPLPRLIASELLDRLLDMPPREWLALGLQEMARRQDSILEQEKTEEAHRKHGTQTSHPLEGYAGRYTHPAYGSIDVFAIDGKLSFLFNGISYALSHWHYDTFRIAGQSEDTIISRIGTKCAFRISPVGEIEEFSAPFDADSPDIVFKRELPAWQTSADYLRQFTGVYEVQQFGYSYTLEVLLRNRNLYAYAVGFPLYELTPGEKGEFQVKAIGGLMRFEQDAGGRFGQVLLIHPYYGHFLGKRKD